MHTLSCYSLPFRMPSQAMDPIDFLQAPVTQSFPTRTAGITHHLKNKHYLPSCTIQLQVPIKP